MATASERPPERLVWLAPALWPVCCAVVCPRLLFRPLPFCVFLLAFFCLARDARAPTRPSVAQHLRTSRIAAASFAIGTLLLSQEDVVLRARVSGVVLTALLFSVGTCVSEQDESNNESLKRYANSYSAGLLCVALAATIDHVRS